MPVKLKIKITKEILFKSANCQTETQTCAFALAVRDIFPDASVYASVIIPFAKEALDKYGSAEVLSSDIVSDKMGFPTSEEMRSFIYEFDVSSSDRILNLPEREFELGIPDWVIEKINIEELKPLLENHPTLQLIEEEN